MYSLQQIHERVQRSLDASLIITNALGQMDWNDVLDLVSGCRVVTQQLNTVMEWSGSVDWNAVSNVATDVRHVTEALGQMDWNDVLAIQAHLVDVGTGVDHISNRLDGIETQLDAIRQLIEANHAMLSAMTNSL